jgi:exosortase B
MSSDAETAISLARPAGKMQSGADKVALMLGAASLLLLYVPTALRLQEQTWGKVEQSYGPVLLAACLWLAWQRRERLAALPAKPMVWPGYAFLAFGLLLYALGRSQDILMFESVSSISVVVAMLLLTRGVRAVRVMLLPLVLILFITPLPLGLVAALTAPLKSAVSAVAAWILSMAGLPVARTGVILMVGQYQLLVADACAGLTSIFTLEAIGLVYMGLRESPSRRHDIALGVLLVPIAFVANVIRVLVLVLVTYYLGDEAGQGFVHSAAGLLLFMVAAALMILTDKALNYVPWLQPRNARHG